LLSHLFLFSGWLPALPKTEQKTKMHAHANNCHDPPPNPPPMAQQIIVYLFPCGNWAMQLQGATLACATAWPNFCLGCINIKNLEHQMHNAHEKSYFFITPHYKTSPSFNLVDSPLPHLCPFSQCLIEGPWCLCFWGGVHKRL
jgi:hypothetical protein